MGEALREQVGKSEISGRSSLGESSFPEKCVGVSRVFWQVQACSRAGTHESQMGPWSATLGWSAGVCSAFEASDPPEIETLFVLKTVQRMSTQYSDTVIVGSGCHLHFIEEIEFFGE